MGYFLCMAVIDGIESLFKDLPRFQLRKAALISEAVKELSSFAVTEIRNK